MTQQRTEQAPAIWTGAEELFVDRWETWTHGTAVCICQESIRGGDTVAVLTDDSRVCEDCIDY